jgi:hypothetical protein
VEINEMQVLESSSEFEKYGMKALGWYHSHPRIKPMPSTKDLSTQLQLQSMIPYCIGIIAGIYSTNVNLGSTQKKYLRAADSSQSSISNSYFSFFRAVEGEDGKAGVAVNVTVHRHACPRHAAAFICFSLRRRSPLLPPWILQGMCRALRSLLPAFPLPIPSTLFSSVVLAENQECHDRRLTACRTDEERVLENTSYGRVLSLFRISSLFPLKRFVEEQSRQLKWSVGACIGAGTSKNVLATAPMALPLSIIESRWGGSHPVHFLNSAPVEQFDFEGDGSVVAKALGSARKRNQPISSEDSSPEGAAEAPLSAASLAVTVNVTTLAAAAADVDQAVEDLVFEQGGGGDSSFALQEQPNVRGRARQQQQQQQQQRTPPPQNTKRQSAISDVVVVDVDD